MALLLAVLILGAALRTRHLDTRPFWVDEAESSINAMTILQHGYPIDSYLGMPIFENTHVWFWPESKEYEFRDVSYSENHLAVYHGWLPLYSIAASFALHGVRPDQPDGILRTKHDQAEQKRRTRAARLPSVFFGLLFLCVAFVGGNVVYGRDAGWAAVCMAAVYPYHLSLSDQARYYSAQVTLTTACSVALWLMITRLRWLHVGLTAFVFVLLFHTHLLSFITAAAMALLGTPFIVRRHRDWLPKLAVFATGVLAGILPWVIVTGFHRHQSRIPRIWPLLEFPSDLLRYPPFNPAFLVPGVLILLVVLWVSVSRKGSITDFLRDSAKRLGGPLLFLGGWTIVGYSAFVLLIPAVSFTRDRLNLSYWGPLFLLAAVMCAAFARIVASRLPWRVSPALTLAVMLLIFFVTGHRFEFGLPEGVNKWDTFSSIFRQLDSMNLHPPTKIYAAPNTHLILSFYSGIPIQDITPVRKLYLDTYRGDIVFIDAGVTLYSHILSADNLQQAAERSAVPFSRQEAEKLGVLLRTRPYREAILKALEPHSTPELESIPQFAKPLLEEHRASVADQFSRFGYELVTRGFEIRDWSDWCAVLKYRFVDPESRRGSRANYLDRLRGAVGVFVGTLEPAVIYLSRWHPPNSSQSVEFGFAGP